MSVPSRFVDPQYVNWLRCASSLVILKESLHDYTVAGVRSLHDNVKHSVTTRLGSHYQCSDCSWKGIRQHQSTGVWSIRCINRICNVWLREILSKHDDPQCKTINWCNADITKWSTDPWQIAKIFMTKGQRNKTHLPQELDSPALLSLLKYCKEFHPINVQLVSDILEIRNKVFHSPDLRVCDTDKDNWMKCMLSLVSSLNIQGGVYTDIHKLKTENIDVSFQYQEIKALQNLVSEVLNEVKALKGHSQSLRNVQIQHRAEIDEVKGKAGDNEAKITRLQAETQQLETDLEGQKSQMETYAQVISTLKEFIGNNPDLSSMKISEELRVTTYEIRELQRQLQTVESQFENMKGEMIRIRVVQEVLKAKISKVKGEQEKLSVQHKVVKAKINAMKSDHEKMRVEQEAVKRKMTTVRGEQKKMRVEQVAVRNQIEILERNQREKQTEMQHPDLSTVNMQCLQKDLLHRYKILNVIPISPLHDSSTTLLDDLYTSVIIEKKDNENFGNLLKQGQPRNSMEPVYLRSYHQLFGDKGNKRLVLKGFMGSGKTAFCRKVVQTWCRVKITQVDPESAGEIQVSSTNALEGEDTLSQFEFLFFIDLPKVNSQEDLVSAIHGQCFRSNDAMFLCKLLQEMPEKILIILDGLDEIGSKTLDFVNDLLERKLYPQITVLVSTRPWQVSKLSLQAHSHYDLLIDVQGFDEEHAIHFAIKVILAFDKDISESLIIDMIKSLRRKKVIATFRSVPLLLLFLTNVWYNDRSLPDQHSVLYSKIIDCMTKRCLDKTKGKHRSHNWVKMSDLKTKVMESSLFVKTFGSKLLELTGKLSYEFLLQRQHGKAVIISREDLLNILDKDEKTAESKLRVLLDCGILSKSDAFSPLERSYSVSFLHLSIQEFLAAVYLTSNEVVLQEFISTWTCLDDVLQNENFVIFTCGLAPHLATPLFSRICEVCDKDSKVLQYRKSVWGQESGAIDNLCSLYKICLNEVSAPLPISDIRILVTTEMELEDFLYKIMTSTSVIKSVCLLFLWWLSAVGSEFLCKIISNSAHLLSLVLWHLELYEGILNLSRLTDLTALELWNVTMSSECSKSLCRSISNCTHLQTLILQEITLHDGILDLSRVIGLTHIKLWNITMHSECSKSLCRSINNCTHLQKLHLDDITLHNSILDLNRVTGLSDLELCNVTMSSECSESIFRSISSCIHLQKLHLEDIQLHANDGILDLSRLKSLTHLRFWNVTEYSDYSKSPLVIVFDSTYHKKLHLEDIKLNRLTNLTSFGLSNVIISRKCSTSLCRYISSYTHMQTLHLQEITLHDSVTDLSRLTGLNDLRLCCVIMSSESSKSLCRNISNCTSLQTLYLENIKTHDSIIDLSRLTSLTTLNLRSVTMSRGNTKSLYRSISDYSKLQNLDLSGVSLFESIPNLKRLTGLTCLKLSDISMSRECSESLCRNISNCTPLQNLQLKNINLNDSILSLRRLIGLTNLSLWSVTICSECSESLCSSINNCTNQQSLHLRDIRLYDSILDLSKLRSLAILTMQSVTMCSENSRSLCRSIGDCTKLQIIKLNSISLHDSILDLSRLTSLTWIELDDVTMSSECSESINKSISNCTRLRKIELIDITLYDEYSD